MNTIKAFLTWFSVTSQNNNFWEVVTFFQSLSPFIESNLSEIGHKKFCVSGGWGREILEIFFAPSHSWQDLLTKFWYLTKNKVLSLKRRLLVQFGFSNLRDYYVVLKYLTFLLSLFS